MDKINCWLKHNFTDMPVESLDTLALMSIEHKQYRVLTLDLHQVLEIQ